ncbi:MAG: FIST signal transduction protein, partial [Nannocystaceae bacterium]
MDSASSAVKTAYSSSTSADQIARELGEAFADASPGVIMFFCAHTLDGTRVSAELRARFPAAQVLGCTSAGEYTDAIYGRGGTAAMAIPSHKVGGCAATLARFGGGVAEGVRKACDELSTQLGTSLRELDPKRYVGIVLIEGSKGNEEAVNEELGNVAPFLSFVGGSAGDDIAFKRTELFHAGGSSDDGAALLVMEMKTPFAVVKTCNYEPTDTSFTITRLGEHPRVILELDGRPARTVYA